MKKFTYIIATLCVVAIGTAIFIGCEKENTFSNKVNIDKIQKDNDRVSYNTIDNPDIFYIEDSLGTITYTLPKGDTVIREDPWGVGTIHRFDNDAFNYVSCEGNGTTCGNAKHMSNGIVKYTGLWALSDREPDMYFYTWDN